MSKNQKKQGVSTWRYIYDELFQDINSLQGEENLKLPSENELSKRFSVTRSTVRKALALLQQQGYIYVIHGVGMFIKPKMSQYSIKGNQNFISGLENQSDNVETENLSIEEIEANEELVSKLGIDLNEKVWKLVRLRIVNSQPIFINYKYFPKTIFPDFQEIYNKSNNSVSKVYEHYEIKEYERVETRVSTTYLNEEETIILQQGTINHGMKTSSINKDSKGRVIEYSDGRWAFNSIELKF